MSSGEEAEGPDTGVNDDGGTSDLNGEEDSDAGSCPKSDSEVEEDIAELEDDQESVTGKSSAEKKKRKSSKLSSDEDDRLEDDDYDLLEENLGIRFKRKFKRVKVIDDDDSDDEAGTATRKDMIAEDLFDLDDDIGPHSSHQKDPTNQRAVAALSSKSYSSEESSEDEIDDFIVDDAGVPIRRPRIGEVNVTDGRLQVAQDIFGVDFELGDFEIQDDDDSDDEARVKPKKNQVKLRDIYEPSVLENLHFTDNDTKIRLVDVPERIQRRNLPSFSKDELFIEEEAGWVFEELLKMKAQLGKVYDNDDSEDWSLNFDQPNERTTLGRKENTFSSGIGGNTIGEIAVSTDLPGDDAWENETVVSQMSTARSVAPPDPPAPADDDDEWGNSSMISQETVSRPTPTAGFVAPPAPTDDDDEWGNSSMVSQETASRPAAAASHVGSIGNAISSSRSAIGFDDDDDWEKGSVLQEATTPAALADGTNNSIEDEINDNVDATKIPPPPSSSVAGSILKFDPKSEENQAMVDKIRKVLGFIKHDNCEIPYIAMYQKDFYMPELSVTDLWTIHRLDIIFSQLHRSKMALNTLLNNIDEYLADETQSDIIKLRLGDDFRPIAEEDYAGILAIKSIEEVNDFRMFITLHYGGLMETLKAYKSKSCPEKETENVSVGREHEEVTEATQQESQDGDISESNLKKTTRKRPVRKTGSRYGEFKKLLKEFLPHYGMSSGELAINFKDEYVKNNPVAAAKDVFETAQPFSCMRFPTCDSVIEAANFVVATDISKEPEIRRFLRNRLFESAALSVTPTELGRKSIDESHPLYTMKYLRNKPVRKFRRDEFLKLSVGEQEKLVEIKLSEEYIDRLKSEMISDWCAWFYEDGFSGIVQGWNLVKKQCLQRAVFELMLPSLVKDLKIKLERDSKNFVLRACRRRIRKLISIGKFKFSFNPENENDTDVPEEWNPKAGIRVMAVAYDSDPKFVPFACVLDSDGSTVNDFIALSNILFFRRPDEQDLKLQAKAVKSLREFIKNSKPHVIVIGGESLEADGLEHLVKEIVLSLHVQTMADDNDDEDDEIDGLFPLISVEVVDNDAAKVFSYSRRGMSEFIEHPVVLRQAISLARKMVDSLIEIGQLFNPDEDILCLKLHPFQSKIPKEDLLDAIEEEFIKLTNQIGLDFNECLADSRNGHMLQFIGGLGPTKASTVLRTFKKKSLKLRNREQLLEVGQVGPVIFRNCAAFIRINTLEMDPDSDDTFIEYLDCTRIHPENYNPARVIAQQALEEEEENEVPGTDPEANQEERVKRALDDPEAARRGMKSLELSVYAKHLVEEEGIPYQLRRLESIRDEYYEMFRDPRRPFESPSVEEIFSFLTKETAQTLYNGKFLVAVVNGFLAGCPLPEEDPVRTDEGDYQCPVCKKRGFDTGDQVFEHFDSPKAVWLRLDNGLRGKIDAEKLSDQKNVAADKRVCKGQPVQCRVLSIHIGKRQVMLTSAGSDLRDEENKFRPPKDPYYDGALEAEHKSKVEKSKANKPCVYNKRAIVHPSFRNMSYAECVARLDSMEVGDAVFRPSSKGTNYLTLTWKIMDGVFQHVSITEQNKPDKLSLGRLLNIDGEDYEDLDEILTRYVYRMASNVRELQNHKNFVDTGGHLEREQAEDILRSKLQENTSQLHYVFSPLRNLPGKFYLSYSLSTKSINMKCAHEIITCLPDGFRFRQMTFESLSHLLRHFKCHFKDPPPTGTPLIKSAMSISTTSSSTPG